MACEICNRFNCTRSFHSLAEQKEFDDNTGHIKEQVEERMKDELKRQISRLKDLDPSGDAYAVNMDDVMSIIDSY